MNTWHIAMVINVTISCLRKPISSSELLPLLVSQSIGGIAGLEYFCLQPRQTLILPVINARVKALESGGAQRINGGGATGILQ